MSTFRRLIRLKKQLAHEGYKIVNGVILYSMPEAESIDSTYDKEQAQMATDTHTETKKVFVVHGRNETLRKAMFDFLRALGLEPLEWSQAVALTGKATPYVGEVLDSAFANAAAIVVLLTPDDEARLLPQFHGQNEPSHETELTPQARPNVLFEAGMAFGHDQNHTVLVEVGQLRPFSDIGGRHVIRMNNSSQRRQEFAQRLRAAGCEVNLDGTDWHSSGNFEDTPPDP